MNTNALSPVYVSALGHARVLSFGVALVWTLLFSDALIWRTNAMLSVGRLLPEEPFERLLDVRRHGKTGGARRSLSTHLFCVGVLRGCEDGERFD